MTATSLATRVSIRQPTRNDAANVYALVKSAPPLELNSCYTYLLLCTHFSSTSAIATRDGQVVGFIGGYTPPAQPDALFVWQVAVAEAARGAGLGRKMMEHILKRETSSSLHWVEASVTPSNAASRRLFQGSAEKWGVTCEISPWLDREDFFGAGHEPEELFRIGPLNFTA